MHVRSAGRMLRAAWTMFRDERTIGTILALVLVAIVAGAYYAGGEPSESSRERGDTTRSKQ